MKTLAVLAISLLPWLAALDSERPEPSAPPPFGDTNKLAPPLDAPAWSAANATNGPKLANPWFTNGWQSFASIYIEEGTNWVTAYLSNAAGEGPDERGDTRIKAKLKDFYAESTVLPAVTRGTDDVWVVRFDPAPTPATNPAPIKLQSAEAARAPQPSFADGVLIATALSRESRTFMSLLSPQEQVALCLRVWQQRLAEGKR